MPEGPATLLHSSTVTEEKRLAGECITVDVVNPSKPCPLEACAAIPTQVELPVLRSAPHREIGFIGG